MRRYDTQTKLESVLLCKEIGVRKTSLDLDIPESTLRTWLEKDSEGTLDKKTSADSQSQAQETKQLRQRVKELERTNKILKDASAFFAAHQKK